MKDPLFSNKIAFAALFFLIVLVAPNILVNVFDHENGHDQDFAIEIEIAPPVSAKSSTAKLSFKELLYISDANIGKKRAAICKSCHSFKKNGINGTGPNLYGVFDREIASVTGFSYSDTLKNLGGKWEYNMLDNLIANSQSAYPGTTMAQKIRKPKHRAEIIAYLNSLSDNPKDFKETFKPEEIALNQQTTTTENLENTQEDTPDKQTP